MSEDGMASLNFTEPCHQVVRFVGRTILIEPVDLQVVVVIVRGALEARLKRFNVLWAITDVESMLLASIIWLRHVNFVQGRS